MSEYLPKDLHMAIGELLGSTRLLVGQVEEIRGQNREFRREVLAEQRKMDDRLVVVEKFMWKAMGLAVAASIVFPVVVTAAGYYLTGVF